MRLPETEIIDGGMGLFEMIMQLSVIKGKL